MIARSKPERTPGEMVPVVRDELNMTSIERNIYRAGLAEGFRRGVEAAADVVDAYPRPITGRIFALTNIAQEIRALRPEGEKT